MTYAGFMTLFSFTMAGSVKPGFTRDFKSENIKVSQSKIDGLKSLVEKEKSLFDQIRIVSSNLSLEE